MNTNNEREKLSKNIFSNSLFDIYRGSEIRIINKKGTADRNSLSPFNQA